MCVLPRNYRLNWNGNMEKFFSYVCNDKTNKELFAFTLNGIAAGVRCMSSMIVVVKAKLPDWLRPTQTKPRETKKPDERDVLLLDRIH